MFGKKEEEATPARGWWTVGLGRAAWLEQEQQ